MPSSLQAPTTVAVPGPSSCITFAPGSPSRRPTSSVTAAKTRLGDGSPATSVATRRSAACSSASARCAASARVRSAVTAARTSEVIAEVAMNSCVASRLSVIESRTNGPSLCAVFQTVIEQTTRIAVAAPRGPKRSAAQSSTGKTMNGTSRCGGSSARITSTSTTDGPLEELAPAQSRRTRRSPRSAVPGPPPGRRTRRRGPTCGRRAQSSPDSITPPRRRASGPIAPLITAARTAQATSARTSPTRARSPRPPVRRRSTSAATTSATVFPAVWASTVANGVEKSPSSRSPITMPGHSRSPPRKSTARPSPAGGQSAATAPSR